MKKSFFALILGLVFVMNSCVALLSPKHQKVELITSSEDNKVSDGTNEIGKGKTVVYDIDKTRRTIHQIEVSAEGHKTSHQVIYPKGRTPIIYPVQGLYFTLLFIPSLLDFGSPIPFVYNKKMTVQEPLELPKYEVSGKRIHLDELSIDTKSIAANSFDVEVKHKKMSVLEEIEAADVAEKRTKLSETFNFSFEESKEAIYSYLRENGYIDTVNKVFKDNNNTIGIEGKLKKYTFYTIDVKGFSDYFKAKGEIVWYIRNNFDEIVDSVVRVDYSDDFVSSNDRQLISDLFQNSYIQLLNSDDFKVKTQFNMDFTTKDELLTITMPQQVVHSLIDAQEASVIVQTKTGHGSGFAISNDGYLLTNYHVVAGEMAGDSNEIWIQQPDGGKLKAELVRYNKFRDIALIKVDSSFSKAFRLDEVKSHKAFQEVYTIGAPKYIELQKSYQKGTVSNDRSAFGVDVIQVSMAVNGGNSGGPLFDSTGKLLGVIVSKLVGYSTEGVGFAIPSYKISEYLNIKQ